VSRTIARHFRLGAGAVHTIENGVDARLFRVGDRGVGGLRQALGLAADDFVIGHVANFRRNKNHIFLLRAFSELARTRRDVKLVLVGTGQDGDPENSEADVARFIAAAGLDGAVRMLGYRPDVQDVLRTLDVCCLVSYREGLPLSVLEAMATGLPVIGTAIEGIQGIVEDEVNGLCVRPDDVPGLVLALTRLLDDRELRQRMGAAARQTITGRYSLQRCVDRTQGLFLSMVPRALEYRRAGAPATSRTPVPAREPALSARRRSS
jgi:glycosyltransferase involved in cell wall biosynthesis